MKYPYLSRTGTSFCAAILLAGPGSWAFAQAGKEKPKAVVKPIAKASTTARPAVRPSPPPKTAGAPSKLDQHVAANMKFLGVLSRYAQTLASAKDPAAAQKAATKLETITKDAVSAGEALVKLGKPDAELEMKLATDADLKMTSQTVAEQTRVAVKDLAANPGVKTILAPAIENFQAALNRVQQAADEPQLATAPASPPAGPAETPPAAEPTPAPAPPEPAKSAADATEVPPPPPPP